MKHIFWLIFIFPVLALGDMTVPPKSAEQQFFQFKNMLSNPGAENGVTGWSASGGTFAKTSTPGEVRNGTYGFSFDASATSQTVTGPTWTTKAATTTNAAAMCYFTTAATDYVLQVYDGTNVVVSTTIGASTTFQPLWLNFAAAASTGYKIRVVSASNAAEIDWDDCYLGDAANLNQVSQATLWGTITWASTANCAWSTTSGTFVTLSADADCPDPTATGNLTAPSTKVPGFTTNFPPGHYVIEATSTSQTANNFGIVSAAAQAQVLGYWGFSDGTTTTEYTPVQVGLTGSSNVWSATPSNGLRGTVTYTAASGAVTYVIGAVTTGSATATVTNQSGRAIVIKVYKFPTTSETAYRSDLTDWFVIADITGANPSLGVSAVTSYTGIESASLTLTPVAGSQPAGAVCSSTNAATTPTTSASVCAAGNESVGANFTIPFAGWYEACFYFGWAGVVDTAESLNPTFQVVETPTAAQTLTQEGGPRTQMGITGMTIATGADQSSFAPPAVCGQLNFASAGTKAVRLMYEQYISGSPDSSAIYADADATAGQRAIRLTVRPMRYSMAAPQLVNSVIAPDYNGVTKINTVTSQSGNYTATVNDETIAFSAAATLSLPAAASVKGKKYTIDTYANFVTIDPNASETICGATTIKIGTNEVFSIQSDGTNWRPTGGSDCIRKDQGYLNCDAGAFFNTDKGTVASVGNRSTGCTATLATGVCAGSGIATGSANENVVTVNQINAYFSTATALLVTGRNNSGTATDFDAYVNISCAR